MLTWRVKKLSFCSLAENLMLNMEKEARWTQEKSLLRTAANEPFGAGSDFLWPGSEIPVFHWCRFQHMQGEVCFGFNNTCVDSAQLWPGERLAGLGVQRESLGTAGKGAGRKSPFPRLLGASCGKGSVLTTSGHWVLWISTKLVRWHQHILLGTSTAGVAWVRRKETCRMRNLGARDGRVIFLSQRTEANKKPAYAGSLSPQNVCMVWENNTNKT